MSCKVNRSVNAPQPHLRPAASGTSPPRGRTSPPGISDMQLAEADVTALRAELLSALREEIPAMFRAELQTALGDNLSSIKSELLMLKTDLSSGISTMQQDLAGLKGTITDMEQSLSTCTDDITSLRTKVETMSKELVKLENKCEDLESRSRRNNLLIVGVPEYHNITSEYVSGLLLEAFALEKEPLVDRAHRALAPKPGSGERPRAVVARLHYYSDCASILKKAREQQRIKIRNMTISVFPDHTVKTARARAAFNDVRRQLQDIQGVRFGILHPAKLRITYEGVQRDFTSPGEAKVYIKTMTK